MMIVDISKYAHSPIHKAIISKDHAALRKIISTLPPFLNPSDICSESISTAEESKADAISAIIDHRDVPNRETPLHLAVKLSDETSTEILMLSGVDWSLQNAQGWNALQEAICNREEKIAMIIVKHCQPLAWAKWSRRLPRLIGTVRRIRDFYMEINFRFESSVLPFVSKIAPSDTYKIWKRGANLRADTTLAGFDGFKIQRSEQTFLFLGDGSEDGKVLPGSFFVVSHRDKEVLNAMDGAGRSASEDEVEQEVSMMCRTNIFRPGIDVTEAVLLPQMTWRKQEKMEMVGPWKAKVYDMHNVVVSIRSRKFAGGTTDEEFLNSCNENENEFEVDDILTEEEKSQLETALKMHSSEVVNENADEGIIAHRHSCYERRDTIPMGNKGLTMLGNKQDEKKIAPSRSSLCVEDNVGSLLEYSPCRSRNGAGRQAIEVDMKRNEYQTGRVTKGPRENAERKHKNNENEFKKGLRPTLCLSPNFPLQTEELLPLLDILANKVKAVRRLRELLTTKFPKGTFPVKVSIPVVPTIRVIVTFTRFEELQPLNYFSTVPPLSPTAVGTDTTRPSSSSWFQRMKSSYQRPNSSTDGPTNRIENVQDPFAIPSDYKWITTDEKKKKIQQKSQSMKAK